MLFVRYLPRDHIGDLFAKQKVISKVSLLNLLLFTRKLAQHTCLVVPVLWVRTYITTFAK